MPGISEKVSTSLDDIKAYVHREQHTYLHIPMCDYLH